MCATFYILCVCTHDEKLQDEDSKVVSAGLSEHALRKAGRKESSPILNIIYTITTDVADDNKLATFAD